MICFRATKWKNYEINFKRRSSAHSLRRGGEGGHRRRFDGNGRVHRLDVILEGNGEFEVGSNSVSFPLNNRKLILKLNFR